MNPTYTHVATTAANTFAYYAVPDFVRRPWLRRLARFGVVAAIIGIEVQMKPIGLGTFATATSLNGTAGDDVECDGNVRTDTRASTNPNDDAESAPPERDATAASEQDATAASAEERFINSVGGVTTYLVAAGVATTVVAGTSIAIEKAIFRRGERRRAAGDRFAHTKQALIASAILAGLTAIIDKFDAPGATELA
ncbi:hypothetical protein INS90_01385 [Trueperella pecoris]|uniref:Uncharacterized protein n=1 Tax=Trueperella pecoris TaxID=2733571 RepID=A0A7M1R3E8_9ACTO|nr:hypothetical protein [Trueperella pecoris]QOR47985.1 hypothetical protein INS90_01385 [Trueperella pecoris]